MICFQLSESIVLHWNWNEFHYSIAIFVCYFNNNNKKHRNQNGKSYKLFDIFQIKKKRSKCIYSRDSNGPQQTEERKKKQKKSDKIEKCWRHWNQNIVVGEFNFSNHLSGTEHLCHLRISINTKFANWHIHMWWFCGCYFYWNTNKRVACQYGFRWKFFFFSSHRVNFSDIRISFCW